MKRIKYILTITFAAVTTLSFASCPVKKAVKVKNTPVDSVALTIKKAQVGDANAQNTLGTWYYTGKDSIKQDYRTAFTWWGKSAKQGNSYAIGNMAMCYQLGRGTKKDSTMAVNLYKSAIRKGNTAIIPQHVQIVENTKSIFSCLLLRDCYLSGLGVEKDFNKATFYLEKAAEYGDVDSQFSQGLSALNTNHADNAVKWFKQAAAKGHTGAIYYYGNLLHKGMGVAQDKAKGAKYLELAASKGFPMANYQLGRIFYEGDGIEQDYSKAAQYLTKAALKGNAQAKWLLGNCYLNGHGVPQDFYRATQWLAEVGATSHQKEMNKLLHEDNEGLFSQYLMGLRKYYVDKDYASAIDYFTKVNKAKNPEGATMLGVCLANKDYTKRNLKKAIKTLTKACETSDVANYYLSAMYETGTGVDKDDKKALELLRTAADKGIAYAQCKLADRYMTGNGVVKDFTKAAELYLMAEAQNYLTPQSAKYLAECYKKKLSVIPDLSDADKRIEQLGKQRPNNSLIRLLSKIEK